MGGGAGKTPLQVWRKTVKKLLPPTPNANDFSERGKGGNKELAIRNKAGKKKLDGSKSGETRVTVPGFQ